MGWVFLLLFLINSKLFTEDAKIILKLLTSLLRFSYCSTHLATLLILSESPQFNSVGASFQSICCCFPLGLNASYLQVQLSISHVFTVSHTVGLWAMIYKLWLQIPCMQSWAMGKISRDRDLENLSIGLPLPRILVFSSPLCFCFLLQHLGLLFLTALPASFQQTQQTSSKPEAQRQQSRDRTAPQLFVTFHRNITS